MGSAPRMCVCVICVHGTGFALGLVALPLCKAAEKKEKTRKAAEAPSRTVETAGPGNLAQRVATGEARDGQRARSGQAGQGKGRHIE